MFNLEYLHKATWFLPVRILLSLLYNFASHFRNKLYDLGLLKIHSVNTPVLSVGNLSVGGSGKTILTQALLKHFVENKIKPAVLSRGYGRTTSGVYCVADENEVFGDPATSGDEPFLIAQNFPGVPVVVAENRFEGAKYIGKNFSVDVIILDDGFQHRRLHRDLDVLILDQKQDSKESHLLPWGRLRESQKNQQRANLVLFSKNAVKADLEHDLIFQLADHLVDYSGVKHPLSSMQKSYGLFAGLGNTSHFFQSVQEAFTATDITISFPDHAVYTAKDLSLIQNHACDFWITTQKDFIKLDPDFCKQNRIYYIMVQTELPTALLVLLKQHFK